MKINHHFSALCLAIAAALPMALPVSAQAQSYSTTSRTSIASFDVEQVQRLRPGEVLAFRLDGAQGATVTLKIQGLPGIVPMNEVRPGQYEGEYTIRQRDRLTASSLVTAQVMKDGQTNNATLSRSLLAGARDPVQAPTSQITEFNVSAPDRVRPGDELKFSMTGTPGAKARVSVQGVASRIALTEVSRGVYEGSYVMRRSDKLRGALVADGYLLAGKRETSQRYQRQLAQGSGNGPYNEGRDNRPQAAAACANCGSIISVDRVEIKSDSPNAVGTIAGGLLGGVLGHQVGGGRGNDLATVAGAIGGAYAGNRVENNMGKSHVYRVAVKLEGGSTQNFDYADDPSMQVGTRVRVENGKLVRL